MLLVSLTEYVIGQSHELAELEADLRDKDRALQASSLPAHSAF
jgi:hypothetical protein